MGTDLTPNSKIVLGYVQGIAKTLLWGGGVAIAAMVARALGADTLKVSSLAIPIGAVVIVFLIGTAAHIFWTCFLITALLRVAGNGDDAAAQEATNLFDAIRADDSIFLRGMVARLRTRSPGSRLVAMSLNDPTTWLSICLSALVIAAILPWHIDNGLKWADGPNLALPIIACIVVVVLNWWAGGLWAIGVSRITTADGFDRFRLFEGSTVFASRASASRAALVLVTIIGATILVATVLA